MPVDSLHPSYSGTAPTWNKAKAFATSEEAVKDMGEILLPRLTGQDDAEYEAYKARGSLSAYFKKTVNTYTGLATKHPAHVEDADEDFKTFLKSCSHTGKSFDNYVYKMLIEFFTFGRAGTLVDLPAGRTYEEPSLFLYPCQSIINWQAEIIDGKEKLTMVVLREEVRKDDLDDKFDQSQTVQYRALTLEDGVYHNRVYNKNRELVDGKDLVPEMNNKPLDFIPFIIHGGASVKPLPLGEVLDLNLTHYQLSCDELHGLHFCGLPTPWVRGVSKKEAPNCIGPTKFLVLEDPEAGIGLLEFSGQGLEPMAKKLKAIEDTIATVAASVVDNSGRVTATQSNIDFANNTASLAGVVNILSSELSMILNTAAKWMKKTEVSVMLTTDFISGKLDSQELIALTQAYIGGAISFHTYWSNLASGEIAEPHRTAETEQNEIEIDPAPKPVPVTAQSTGASDGADE